MLNERQLAYVMTFRDQASAQINRVGQAVQAVGAKAGHAGQQLNQFGSAAHNTAGHVGHLTSGMGGLVGMFEMLAVGAIGHGALETLSEFGQRMSTVGAITGATSSQMSALRDQTLVLDVRTRFSATQVAEGMRQLARSGLEATQIMRTLHSTLDLAAAGDIEVSQGTDIMTSTLNAFRLGASDASRVADVLAYTSKHANTTVAELGESMKYVGATAGAMHIPLEQVAAALGALGRGGLRGSMAGTSLRQALNGLLATTHHSQAGLRAMGLTLQAVDVQHATATTTINGQTVALHGLEAAIHNLSAANLTPRRAAEIFGTRSATGGLILVQQLETIRELNAAMERTPTDARQNAISFLEQNARLASTQVEGLRHKLTDLMDIHSQLYRQAADNGATGLNALAIQEEQGGPSANLRDRLAQLGTMSRTQMRNVFGPAADQIRYILDRFDDVKDRLSGSQADIDGMARKIAFAINNNLSGALERLHAAMENFILGSGQDTFGPVRNWVDNIALAIRMTTDSAYHLHAALDDIAMQVSATTNMHPHQFDFMQTFQGDFNARERAFTNATTPDELERYNTLWHEYAHNMGEVEAKTKAMGDVTREVQSTLNAFDAAVTARTNTIKTLRSVLVTLATLIGTGMLVQGLRLLAGSIAKTPWGLFVTGVALAVGALDRFRQELVHTGSEETWGDRFGAVLDILSERFNALVQGITGAWGSVTQFFTTNTGLMRFAVGALTGVLGVYALSIVASSTATFLATNAFRLVSAAVWLFNIALRANPLVLVISLVAGLVVGLIALTRGVDQHREAMALANTIHAESVRIQRDSATMSDVEREALRQNTTEQLHNARAILARMSASLSAAQAEEAAVVRANPSSRSGIGDARGQAAADVVADRQRRIADQQRIISELVTQLGVINNQMSVADTAYNTVEARSRRRMEERLQHARDEEDRLRANNAGGTGVISGRQQADDGSEDTPDATDAGRAHRRDAVAEFITASNARIAALQLGRHALEQYNAEQALGISQAAHIQRDGESDTDYHTRMVELLQREALLKHALRVESVAEGQERARAQGVELAAAQQRAAIVHMSSADQVYANALLDEQIRLANEEHLSLDQLNKDQLEQARILAGQAVILHKLAQEHQTFFEGVQAGLDEWSLKVQDVGGQMKTVIGNALDGLASNMTDFLMGQKVNWAEFARSVIKEIMKIIVQLLIMQAIKFALGDGGVVGGASKKSAYGNVFDNASRYASGSVFANSIVSSPTFFRFGAGGHSLGLMGEAGPEAVLPLKRLPGGKLGVMATGTGGGANVFAPQVTINVAGGTGDKATDTETAKKIAVVFDTVLAKKMQEFEHSQMRQRNRLVNYARP